MLSESELLTALTGKESISVDELKNLFAKKKADDDVNSKIKLLDSQFITGEEYFNKPYGAKGVYIMSFKMDTWYSVKTEEIHDMNPTDTFRVLFNVCPYYPNACEHTSDNFRTMTTDHRQNACIRSILDKMKNRTYIFLGNNNSSLTTRKLIKSLIELNIIEPIVMTGAEITSKKDYIKFIPLESWGRIQNDLNEKIKAKINQVKFDLFYSQKHDFLLTKEELTELLEEELSLMEIYFDRFQCEKICDVNIFIVSDNVDAIINLKKFRLTFTSNYLNTLDNTTNVTEEHSGNMLLKLMGIKNKN